MNSKNRESKGFTVAELIVAMTISAITLLSGYELFEALKSAGDRESEDLAATAGIIHGLDRVREDLLHAVPRAESDEPIFVGSNPTLDGHAQATPVLGFYSLCTGYAGDGFRGLRQMCQVRYELVVTQDSVGLYRSAVPAVGAGPAPTEDRELILDRIEQVRIAFYCGQQWQPSFSSEKQLPAGVELIVTAYGQVWPLSITLPCGGGEEPP